MSTSLKLSNFTRNLDANGDLASVGGLNYPATDGTAGQVLATDGSGTLSFTDASGGISNVVEDTTPQLGGDLDLNSKAFSGTALFKSGSTEMLKIMDAAALTGVQSNVNPLSISTANSSMSLIAGTSESGGGTISLLTENQTRIGIASTGPITFNNSYTFPTSDGTEGTVLTTNGSGALSWSTPASGGISSVFEDSSPALGNILNGNNHGIYAVGQLTEVSLLQYTSPLNYLPIRKDWGDQQSGIELRHFSGNNVVIKIPDMTNNSGYTLTLPVSNGNAGQVLTTDGSGTLSFADASGGSSFTASLFHTLDNPNAYSTSASDYFGLPVAISGNYAIVGAYLEDDAGGNSSGKAYIFNVTTGSLVHTLDNPNAYGNSSGDNFGLSVAISGNYAIVGAYLEDDAGGASSGKAYIFNVSTGALLHTLDNPNAYSTSANDRFGESVAISGNYAIVGAWFEDDAGGTQSGKAYIFDVTTGSLVHTLDNPNAYSTSSSDYFSWSVAISGNYAIVGAKNEDDAGGNSSGKAYIFNVTTGALLHTLDNPNAYSTSGGDNFGLSVAISGNYAIVGAYLEDDAGGASSGKAYIFNVSTGALLHTLDNPNAYSTSANDRFGESVAISGNYAIVGAWFEDDAGGTQSGKAYIFDVTTGSLVHTLDNPNAYSTSASDYFGLPVAISGNYAIVGAQLEDDAGGNSSGKAYIYQLPNAQPYVLDAAETAGFSSGTIKTTGIEEAFFTDFTSAGIFNVYAEKHSVYYAPYWQQANRTVNIAATTSATLNSVMENGGVRTFAVALVHGPNAYYVTDVTIDGSAPASIKWLGGAPTSATPNSTEVYTFTVIKVSNNSFDVLAQVATYE